MSRHTETELEMAERIEWEIKDKMAAEFLKSYTEALMAGYTQGVKEGIESTLHIARQLEIFESESKA